VKVEASTKDTWSSGHALPVTICRASGTLRAPHEITPSFSRRASPPRTDEEAHEECRLFPALFIKPASLRNRLVIGRIVLRADANASRHCRMLGWSREFAPANEAARGSRARERERERERGRDRQNYASPCVPSTVRFFLRPFAKETGGDAHSAAFL